MAYSGSKLEEENRMLSILWETGIIMELIHWS